MTERQFTPPGLIRAARSDGNLGLDEFVQAWTQIGNDVEKNEAFQLDVRYEVLLEPHRAKIKAMFNRCAPPMRRRHSTTPLAGAYARASANCRRSSAACTPTTTYTGSTWTAAASSP